jgi:hypothetical protein
LVKIFLGKWRTLACTLAPLTLFILGIA